ncbi:protein NRT1/ PTR FAMILY 5.5-like [Cannabis sativa]|uniref:protein NRT1/ PTR FAMILY 5.5-like n=1 Tax=Cannabis sativa TaxID=3483 RepID=UPI0029CA8CA1|nr:protein NRT1/ PTR FAMILY 5.5-like [Cannabis sativa]
MEIIENIDQTKKALCKIPFCMTFFMLGVVSSLGETYFIEQANTMNNMVGRYKVPLGVLQLCYEFSQIIFPIIYLVIMKKLLNFDSEGRNDNDVASSKYAGCVGIAVSIIFAILCCFAAANIEKRRLDKVPYMKNDDIIPMSMFWLVPQFFLLGSFDGILEKSIDLVFNHQAHTLSDHVMGIFSMAIIGFGKVSSVLSALIAQKITAWGDNTSWFVENLNDSRLDKYYWILAALLHIRINKYTQLTSPQPLLLHVGLIVVDYIVALDEAVFFFFEEKLAYIFNNSIPLQEGEKDECSSSIQDS